MNIFPTQRPFICKLLTFIGLLGPLLAGCGTSSRREWAMARHFPAEAWQRDRRGCAGERQQLVAALDSLRRDLRGFSQDEIVEVLGRPDAQRLEPRNQKLFVYFLEKGPQCQQPTTESPARTVAVRFNATGYVTEITYHSGRP